MYHAHDNPNLGAEMVNFPGVFVPDDIPDKLLNADQRLARARRDELVKRQYGKPSKADVTIPGTGQVTAEDLGYRPRD